MEAQPYPPITQVETGYVIRQLVRLHYPESQQSGSTLTLKYTLSNGRPAVPKIVSTTTLKNSFVTDLFDNSPETDPSFGKVSSVAGYPFDVVIAYPPYDEWFPPDNLLPNQLPTEVMFMYFAFQLLRVGGLLVMVSDADRRLWPKDQISKIGNLIDVHPLPSVFRGLPNSDVLVYRRKPTDAVRYEESS